MTENVFLLLSYFWRYSYVTRGFYLQQLVLGPPMVQLLFEKHNPIVLGSSRGVVVVVIGGVDGAIVLHLGRTVRAGREMVEMVFHIRRNTQTIFTSNLRWKSDIK